MSNSKIMVPLYSPGFLLYGVEFAIVLVIYVKHLPEEGVSPERIPRFLVCKLGSKSGKFRTKLSRLLIVSKYVGGSTTDGTWVEAAEVKRSTVLRFIIWEKYRLRDFTRYIRLCLNNLQSPTVGTYSRLWPNVGGLVLCTKQPTLACVTIKVLKWMPNSWVI